MRKVKFLIVAFLVLGLLPCIAQRPPIVKKNDVLIKFTPTSLADHNLPALELGAAWFFSNRMGVQLKYGRELGIDNLQAEPYRHDGDRILGEIQYFAFRTVYFAIEAGYSQNSSGARFNYNTLGDPTMHVNDDYWSKTTRKFVTMKAGIVIVSKSHFVLSGYAGVGPKRLVREIHDLEYNSSIHEPTDEGDDLVIFPMPARDDDEITPEDKIGLRVSLGVDLCYKFHIGK